jgi:very-short-patch-repair endonuclease
VRANATETAQAHARTLRRDTSDAEQRFWQHLRNRQMGGAKFRRQHPIGPFIADFCCIEANLVVEVDGGQHAERPEEDERRTAYMGSKGYRVIRFWNNEVLQRLESVLQEIEAELKK